MKTLFPLAVTLAAITMANICTVSAGTLYVALDSPNPSPPYANWATAATTLQQAADAAAPGDEVVVTNGTYATGGRVVGTNLLANRVAVDKPLTLRSVNGPQFTIIKGAKAPGGGNGAGAIRCVYLADGASLSGFTLTNGATRDDYEVWMQAANRGGGVWCASTNAVLTNCVIVRNSAFWFGGGAVGGTLNHCTLTGNSADCGGGAYQSILYDSTLTGNSAMDYGGGAYESTLFNCMLSGNSGGDSGGGVYGGNLYNCTLTGNSAVGWYSIAGEGGGAYGSTLYNCTLTGNTADAGGGAAACTFFNCIVYFNRAREGGNYTYAGFTFAYSCTTPLPPGPGNIDADPQLAAITHLAPNSPCIGGGSSAHASGVDIDGELWASPPAMGVDQPGPAIGPISVEIDAGFTRVTTGYPVSFTARNVGLILKSVWDFDDGTLVTNQPYVLHAWAAPGLYTVRLTGYNDSHPGGIATTVGVVVSETVRYYVNAASSNPIFPYMSWATAAATIQEAIGAGMLPGRLVLVTNGVYRLGTVETKGRNRVALTNEVVVRSVNGPEVTVIEGESNGARCAYVGHESVLDGFTLTKGSALGEWPSGSGGGLFCESFGVVTNCVITGNSARYSGGGVAGGTLHNCALKSNSTIGEYTSGGGASGSTLYHCMLTGNSAQESGGGACASALYYCELTDNSAAASGGGAAGSTLSNCTLTGNHAKGTWYWDGGGGVRGGMLNNCLLTGNTSSRRGGGAMECTLNNCTLTGNSAVSGGGAASGLWGECLLTNCIVYFNTAPFGANYDSGTTLDYCCTTPLPARGTGNITLDPQLASASHLSAASPCRGAGSADSTTGVDIDGEAWAAPPSIGCDEYHAGAVTGSLSVDITATFTNVAVGFPVELNALIDGRTSASVWDFGDGVMLSNRPYATHAWLTPGDYAVVLRAHNETNPGGVSTARAVHVVTQPVHYVAAGSASPRFPYASWATAATHIQEAVDAGNVPGALVLVSNGVYASGGRAVGTNLLANRVAVDKPLTVRSVNGPQFTVIAGYQVPGTTNGDGAIRCVYLTNGASLSGFTLTNGATRTGDDLTMYSETSGGGLWGESTAAVASNCVLVGNSAALCGGGAFLGTLKNCTLTSNHANGTNGFLTAGGGAASSALNQCILIGNSAGYGGGAVSSTLNHCILTGNSAGSGGGAAADLFWGSCTLYNCTLAGNSAAGDGGGAYDCTLGNCTLIGNSAACGGGAAGSYLETSTLGNCTLIGNSAAWGGGAWRGTLNNCIVYFNAAAVGANYYDDQDGVLNYCCTTPLPTNGVGNIESDPLFVNAATGDFRLRPDSPCIDAGTNLTAFISTDILGLPRNLDGNGDGIARVDMGAYEFNPYRFEPALQLTANGLEFTVRGEPGKSVRLERSRNLVTWELVATVPIPASGQTLIDPAATSEPFLFYRAVSVTMAAGFFCNVVPYPSAMRTIQIWAGYNGSSGPVTEAAPSLDLTTDVPGLDTVVTRYTNHPPGGAVELWTINGSSHNPTLSSEFSPRVIDWLLAHPKP